MKYTSRNPNGVNQVASSSVAVTVLNTDVAVFTTSSLTLTGSLTASSAIISGNVTVLGTASINNLVVNQTKYSSGSNQLGDGIEDTQTLFGTVRIPTGSFTVTGSSIMSGSLNVTGGITGSLFGTASYVPTLDQVTTAGNTTANSISVGGINATDNFIFTLNRVVNTVANSPTLRWTGNNVGSIDVYGDQNTLIVTQALKASSLRGSHVNFESNAGSASAPLLRGTNGYTGGIFFIGGGGVIGNAGIGFSIGNYTEGMRLVSTGNLLIGTTTDGARLRVRGSGTTSSTTTLRVENANASSSFTVRDDGATIITGNTTITGSLTVVTGSSIELQVTNTGVKIGNNISDIHPITGSIIVSGSITGSFSGSGIIESASFASTASFVNPLTQNVSIRGLGTTSATTALRVENANASASLQVRDDGSTLFAGSNGTVINNQAGTFISSNGTIHVQRSIFGQTYGLRVWNGAGWFSHNAIEALAFQHPIYGAQGSNGAESPSPLNQGAAVLGKGGVGVYGRGVTPSGDVGSIGVMATTLYVKSDGNTSNYNRSASAHIIGLTTITGSTSILGETSVYKSGSTVLDIQGSQGQLFSVVDSLTGSLMSVNDVSGLPILEVFSDDRIVMGTYGNPAMIITGSVVNVTGSLVTQGQTIDPALIWFMS
jgi:hypothetical protein